MADDNLLSTGCIRAMYDDQVDDPITTEPTLQILSVKKIPSAGLDRYRLIVSDGECFAQSMLATQQNHLVVGDDAVVQKNAVIKLLTYALNELQGRRIVICLTLEGVAQPSDKIGNPVAVEPAAPAAESRSPAAAAAGRGGSNASSTSAAKSGRAGAGKAGGSKAGAPIYPIEGLSPYQNKWTIKARVTTKSDIRHWSNQKGDGKLFSVNLLDETGEIKATGFNDACDNLYPLFEEGKVYYISKARVNIAKKQFSNLTNEYEIMFERDTDVQLCEDQDAAPQIKYNFVELAALGEQEKDATVDVLGIVKDNGEVSEITAKATSKQIKKRELTICDRSGYQVRVTLWGRSAESWQESDNGVFAFKGAKVGDFGGRTLSMGGQSTIAADPDIPEAHELRGWFDTEGQSQNFATFQSGAGVASAGSFKKDEFKTFEEVTSSQLGMGEQPDYFSNRATITFIKHDNLSYPACPADRCNKKVSMESENEWRCEKCNKTYPAPEYRYIISLCANDFTNQVWLSGFNDLGIQLLGKTADEVQVLKEEDNSAFLAVVQNALGKMYNFNIRAKADNYRDEMRVRYHIQKAAPVNFVEAAKQMLETLEQWGP